MASDRIRSAHTRITAFAGEQFEAFLGINGIFARLEEQNERSFESKFRDELAGAGAILSTVGQAYAQQTSAKLARRCLSISAQSGLTIRCLIA